MHGKHCTVRTHSYKYCTCHISTSGIMSHASQRAGRQAGRQAKRGNLNQPHSMLVQHPTSSVQTTAWQVHEHWQGKKHTFHKSTTHQLAQQLLRALLHARISAGGYEGQQGLGARAPNLRSHTHKNAKGVGRRTTKHCWLQEWDRVTPHTCACATTHSAAPHIGVRHADGCRTGSQWLVRMRD